MYSKDQHALENKVANDGIICKGKVKLALPRVKHIGSSCTSTSTVCVTCALMNEADDCWNVVNSRLRW